MRRLLATLPWIFLAGCSCGGREGAIRVEITVQGFSPGCIDVVATDDADPAGHRTAATLTPGAGETTFTAGVYRPQEWSHDVTVTVSAREGGCAGNVVDSKASSVTVGSEIEVVGFALQALDADGDGFVATADNGTDCNDGAGAVHPGAPETCDGVDQDCEGGADEGFALGSACAAGACAGQTVCASDGGTLCSADDVRWYPDDDGDQHGRADAGGIAACSAPAGFVGSADDCDDDNSGTFPGAPEQCDGEDDNCSGAADETFGVGQACTGGGCPGVTVCNGVSATRCEVPPAVSYYVDADLDQHGSSDVKQSLACAGYGPDAGQSTLADDCDDSNAATHPGAPERCDGVDNTCTGDVDEGYVLGGSCTDSSSICAAQIVCAPDGGTRCFAPQPSLVATEDDDLDGFGRGGLPSVHCVGPGTGWSSTAGDCDDGYSYTHPGAKEICDGRDNDCDSTRDEDAGCPATPAWVRGTEGGAGQDWLTVATWRDGGTGVWLGGDLDELQVKRPSGNFVDRKDDCGGAAVWLGNWADPVSGRVFLSGFDSILATHDVESNTCERSDAGAGFGIISALHGYNEGASALMLAASENGRSGFWDGGQTIARLPDVGGCFEDVHGISPALTFGVGSFDGTCGQLDTPGIYRLDGGWQAMSTSGLPHVKFIAVHVVNPRLAYAAGGNSGTGPASLAVWDGTSWTPHSLPPGALQLTGVVAFGRTSVFVVGDRKLWGFDGGTWTDLASANTKLLWDIAANGPDDIWAVGDDGTTIHWPD